jgi:hypothetical protein
MRIVALALATSLAAHGGGTSVPLTDPYQIFANARTFWMAQRYPASLRYTVAVQASAGGAREARHYSESWSAQSNAVIADPVSLEERANPYKPSPGVSIAIFIFPIANIGGPRKGTGINTDLVGVPVLSPNYAFEIAPYVPPSKQTPAQLVAEIRAEYHDPLPPKRANALPPSEIPTIAVVAASQRRYIISSLGTEPYDDHQDYHLQLKPVSEPGRYRLREMWIDTRTFATDKLIQDGNFSRGSATRVSWSVTFLAIDGAQYIDSESETTPLAKGAGALRDVTISFGDITPAAELPAVGGPVPFGAIFEPTP